MKWNNSQLNFAPNLLHLAPPTVKAHLKNLKKFGTKFPQEYKNNYRKMTEDFPIEFHTTVSLLWSTLPLSYISDQIRGSTISAVSGS